MAAAPPPSFRGDWITPDHPEYPKAIARWAKNAERRAAAVAFVRDADDVALVLGHAQAHGIEISIRGGGHSASGASSTENGIVIDLSRYLAGVRVDPAKKLAYVGGGALWESVDRESIKHGLATVAGTVNHTGVGGLTLGGGYGFLTGQHGLALDNVVQATLVTADQQIRTVNAEENPDLFWAIRGAGCNFGIVTEFVFTLHPQRERVFAGAAMYPAAALDKIMSVLIAWWDKGLDEKEVVFQGLVKGPDRNPMIVLVFFWNGPGEEGRAHFEEFFDIGPFADTCSEIPFEAVNAMDNERCPHGRNRYMTGAFVTRPDAALAADVLKQVQQLAKDGITATMFFEYIPVAKVLRVPNDATAHIRGQRINCVVFGVWKGGEERGAEIKRAVGKVVDLLLQSEKHLPIAKNTGYGNYVAGDVLPNSVLDVRISASTIFEENYPRLQQLKKIYDPNMVFSKWCPIVPAP